MSEIQKQIDNAEIQGISDKLDKLDKEYNKNSAILSRKLVSIEEKIEELQSDEKINQKYNIVLEELQYELKDLREDGNIDDKNTNLSDYIHNNVDKIDMPKGHIVEYEGKIGEYDFIITRDEKSGNNKLLLNRNGKQSEVKINNFIRYRDGGTTIIKTDIGEFYFPTPFKKNASSTFTNNDGEKINIETGEEINILNELKSITGTELFTKNKELFTKIHNNFNNTNIIDNETLNMFKSKVRDYVEKNGYKLKEGFKLNTDKQGNFIIQAKYLEKVPDNDYETELLLSFG